MKTSRFIFAVAALTLTLLMPPARAADKSLAPGQRSIGLQFPPALIGVSSSGYGHKPNTQDRPATPTLEILLDNGLRRGLWRIWCVTPGQWPADFTPAAFGAGPAPDYAATDELARQAARFNAELMPMLPSAALDPLGRGIPGARPFSPRAQYLYELAERYDGDGNADMPDPQGARIRFWRLPIPLQSMSGGANPADLIQLSADAEAIMTGAQGSNILADLGPYSTEADPAVLQRLAAFTSGVIRSSLHGAGVEVVLHKPDIQSLLLGFKRLRSATAGLPLWTLGLRVGDEFAAGLPPNEDPDLAAGAYLGAYASLCLTAAFGGGLIWEGLYTPEGSPYRAPGAARQAAERLAAELKPFYRGEFDDSQAPVYLFTFNRQTEPATWIVFWDWAADPDYVPGMTRPFTLPVRQDTFRVVPLVDDALSWPETKTMEGTKMGLELELGRVPLLIERANFGRAVEYNAITATRATSPSPEAPAGAPKESAP